MRLQHIPAMRVATVVLWVVTPYAPVSGYQRFRETCYLYFRCGRLLQSENTYYLTVYSFRSTANLSILHANFLHFLEAKTLQVLLPESMVFSFLFRI
jgi:hypothetical protein